MNIIPSGLSPDNRRLAEQLMTGAGSDRREQAAVALLLRLPGLLDRPDVIDRAVLISGQDAHITWAALARDVATRALPVSTGEAAAVQVACDLAGTLGDALSALDATLRRAVVEAVAHAAGVPLAPQAAAVDPAELAREVGSLLAGLGQRARAADVPGPTCGVCGDPVRTADDGRVQHTARRQYAHLATLVGGEPR